MDEFDFKADRLARREKQAAKKLWLRGRKYVECEQEYVPYERQHSERRGGAHRFVKFLREQHTDTQHVVKSAWRAMFSKKHLQERMFWRECSRKRAAKRTDSRRNERVKLLHFFE